MNALQRSERDDELLVRTALETPLPPSPVSSDARWLWMAARHARRLRVEGQISQIVTVAQIAAGALVAATIVRFVDWQALWASVTSVSDDPTWLYAATGVLAAGALAALRGRVSFPQKRQF